MNKTIYFIRHGETDYNKQGIVQGSGVDSSLNKLGRAQAQAFFEYYNTTVDFDIVFTSALKRTHETVAPFVDTGLRWEKWAEINEMNWGVFEGQKYKPSMRGYYKRMIGQWARGNFKARLEGGESAEELSSRLGMFLDHIKNIPEENLLVCSHGRSLRCLICLIKGQHLREMEAYKHSNTGLFKVHLTDGKFEVELENDTKHLEALISRKN